MPVTYLPGDGVLIGTARRWLLLDAGVSGTALNPLWTALQAGTSTADLAEVVRRSLPGTGFALIDLDHPAGAIAEGDIGVEQQHDAVVVRRERAAETATGTWLPTVGGIVHADAVRLVRASAPATVPGSGPVDAAAIEVPHARPREGTAERAPLSLDRLAGRADPPLSNTALSNTALQPTAPEPVGAPEQLWAIRCPEGHLSPAERPRCRVCGTPLPTSAQPEWVTRPPLGRLVLPDGRWVLLDRGAVLGRQPQPRPGGDPWPHLVHLPSDLTALSRQHLALDLVGWRVLVRDLDSLGGTVRVPVRGAEETLHPGDTYALDPGDRLVLADEYEVRFAVGDDDTAAPRTGPSQTETPMEMPT